MVASTVDTYPALQELGYVEDDGPDGDGKNVADKPPGVGVGVVCHSAVLHRLVHCYVPGVINILILKVLKYLAAVIGQNWLRLVISCLLMTYNEKDKYGGLGLDR